MDLTGIHHLTAVSARIRENYRFYTLVMGMRLVKRTVNQDDVSAYHLFYADGVGSPGTDLTFFDWPALPERRGSRSVVRTSLRVDGAERLDWWKGRLHDAGVITGHVAERDGRLTLDLEDPEGQRLSLVDDGGAGEAHPWDRSPVPAEHQIRGLGPIVMSVNDIGPTDAILQGVMNMRPVREYADTLDPTVNVRVYEMGKGGPAAELHVATEPGMERHHQGAGGVHHVAFRTPTFEEYDAWLDRLNSHGVRNTGAVDRYWFRSMYFREPGGVLFEIATDGPGFASDESPDTLGETLSLPPFLEGRRQEIVSHLKPID